jgi:hypothetical protein
MLEAYIVRHNLSHIQFTNGKILLDASSVSLKVGGFVRVRSLFSAVAYNLQNNLANGKQGLGF